MQLDINKVLQYFSPTEAAALAVLVDRVRSNMSDSVTSNMSDFEREERRDISLKLEEIEKAALDSIHSNTGRTVMFVGMAAKQMNPLLS